jgi:hypothetical protein
MVVPIVAYGAWALGGLIVGACAKAGIDQISETDHQRLEKLNKKYEAARREAELADKHAQFQAESAEKAMTLMKKAIALAKLYVELQKELDQVTDVELKTQLKAAFTRDFVNK